MSSVVGRGLDSGGRDGVTGGGEGSQMGQGCAWDSVAPPVPSPPTLLVPGLVSDHVEDSGPGELDDGGWGPCWVEGGRASFPGLSPAPPCPLD